MNKVKSVLLILFAWTGQPVFAVGNCTFHEAPISGGHIALQRVASGLTQPVGIVFTPSQLDRFYVIEKPGRIIAVKLGGQLGTVLDIRDRVSLNNPETGLLGLAFHPNFPQDRRIFVNYVSKDQLTTRVSSFSVGANGAASPSSEKIIMEFKQPYGNHNGGDVKFGPDGMLYISVGDGGAGGDPHGHAQNLATLFGSILRIDVSKAPYGIPRDNPFVGQSNVRGEIWAYGLRNPWRFSFDKMTGTMWAGDVGQDQLEEIDVIKKGGNYGWNIKEGQSCYNNPTCNSSGLTDPLWQYSRESGRSVTGGYVYRGQAIRGLASTYLYGDFYTGKIWGLKANRSTRQVQNKLLLESELFVSTFGEDAYGELYVADHQRGEVYKLVEPAKFGRGLVKSMVPTKLSETGCFKSMNPPVVTDRLTKFKVNSPLWTDYAFKERFLSLPFGEKAKFELDGEWSLPKGSTLVKNFHFDLIGPSGTKRQIVETRLLVKTEKGYLGFSYAWNSEGTEAFLLADKLTRNLKIQTPKGPETFPYLFPSRAQCVTCHLPGGFGPLALTTQQTNLAVRQSNGTVMNQIHHFVNKGILDRSGVPADMDKVPRLPSPKNPNVSVELRARSYLHANCSHCHNQAGGLGRGMFDMRWNLTLAQTNLCRATPLTGDMGIPGATILKPGEPQKSLVYLRTITENPKFRMPPMGSHLGDPLGAALLKEWTQHVQCP